MQALKARGEPLLSSFECTPAGIKEYFQPLHWKLTELLSPRYATFLPLLLCSSVDRHCFALHVIQRCIISAWQMMAATHFDLYYESPSSLPSGKSATSGPCEHVSPATARAYCTPQETCAAGASAIPAVCKAG